MRLCKSSCRTCCPTNDSSPCRTIRHNDRRLDACRLAAVSSHPRTTVRWISLRSGIRCGEAVVWLFAAIDLLLHAMFKGFLPDAHFGGTGRKVGLALVQRKTLWFAAGCAGRGDALGRGTAARGGHRPRTTAETGGAWRHPIENKDSRLHRSRPRKL